MIKMIRPTWSPETDHQRKLLDDAVRAARKADVAEEEAWQLILRAREAGVPDTVLCERSKRSRATLNRRFGPRAQSAE